MKKEIKDPNKQANTGGYSSGIEVDGWVFVSGQGSLDMETGEYKEGTIEEETILTLENVERVLKQAGCTRADVVKSTCHLEDIKDFQKFDKTYREFFTGTILPTRTTTESGLGGIKVEIDVIAYKKK
ncbi:MAG: RidA family protein [Chthoniobacterales bacterium]